MKTINNNEDKISNLSNDLLVIILSLLPFKETTRTSVLSTRWQYVWLETKNIEFDESFFVIKNEASEEDRKRESRRKLIEFSKKWCQNYRQQNICNFRLVLLNPGDYVDDLKELLKFVIARNVRALELDFSDSSWDENDYANHKSIFELPKFVYKHAGFVSIKLYSCKVWFSEFQNPAGIKYFSLGWTDLSNDQIYGFIAKCPLLEGLSLYKCWDVSRLSFCAPRLKSLVVDKCSNIYAIDIDAKNMKHFNYCGRVIDFRFDYLRTMEVAEVDFPITGDFYDNAVRLHRLLNLLWSTKVLTVCSYLLLAMPCLSVLPNLECVQHLILKAELYLHEYCGISYLLESCPFLESLTFDLIPTPTEPLVVQKYFHRRAEDHPFLQEHEISFRCLKTLKTIEVKEFRGKYYEALGIKYFIKYGTALERVSISLAKDNGKDGIDMRSTYRVRAQSLATLSRASPALKFVIEN